MTKECWPVTFWRCRYCVPSLPRALQPGALLWRQLASHTSCPQLASSREQMIMIKTFSGMNFDFPNKKSSEFALGRRIVRFAWRQDGTPPGRSSSQVSAALAANLANVWPEFFLPKSHTPKNLVKNTSSLTGMMKHFSSYRNATKSEGTGRSKLKELINRG